MASAVIFGETGFRGVCFRQFFLDQRVVDKFYLFDVESMRRKLSLFRHNTCCCQRSTPSRHRRRPPTHRLDTR